MCTSVHIYWGGGLSNSPHSQTHNSHSRWPRTRRARTRIRQRLRVAKLFSAWYREPPVAATFAALAPSRARLAFASRCAFGSPTRRHLIVSTETILDIQTSPQLYLSTAAPSGMADASILGELMLYLNGVGSEAHICPGPDFWDIYLPYSLARSTGPAMTANMSDRGLLGRFILRLVKMCPGEVLPPKLVFDWRFSQCAIHIDILTVSLTDP